MAIKVLLAIWPRMLSDVVKHLVELQPDMEVVREGADPSELLLAIGASKAEVAIITPIDSGKEAGMCSSLLAAYPDLKIMALSAEGDAAVLHSMGAPETRLEDMGEASLLGAIHGFMQ